VNLDAVKTCGHRVARALPERGDHIGDFMRLQRARRAGISAPGRRHRRGFRDDQAACGGALPIIFRVQWPRRKARSLRRIRVSGAITTR
jgi:hypothetical protein